MRRAVLISFLLILATVAAYWPVRQAGFVNFDDNQYVTNNPKVFRGLSSAGVVWAFTTFHASNWHPVTWVSHMLDCQVFGENPAAHHWVNVGLHAANAVLLFLLLWRLTGALECSGFVAALFALHPLHVGSVAWVAERKDVLSTLFGLLCLGAYARFAERRRINTAERGVNIQHPTANIQHPMANGGHREGNVRHPVSGIQHLASSGWAWYLLALLLFALGLMSKPMLVTLPFVMLLLDFWPLARLRPGTQDSGLRTIFPLVREKLPFFTLSIAAAVVTFLAQKSGGAVAKVEDLPIGFRLENASLAYIWYLAKTCWPTRLCTYYPFPQEIDGAAALGAGMALAGISGAVLWLARRAPFLVTGWFWYLVTLVPVIGVVQVGSQAVADRYTYIPLVGLFIMVVWGAAALLSKWRYRYAVLAGVGTVVLAGCAMASYVQTQYWRDAIMLFGRVLEVRPVENALAHHNLAHALSLAGDQRDAIPHFREAVRLHPDFAVAHMNWGNCVGVQGKLDEAITHYRDAIHCMPDYEQAYYQLANALALQLKLDEAKTNFLTALHYKPDYPEAHTKLGNVLLLQGASAEALAHLREAVRLRPDYEEGQYYLGAALARERNFKAAAACFRAAIKAKPTYVSALNDLAWLLATQPGAQPPDVAQAVQYARRACELTRYKEPKYLDTLAVALSESGQRDEAITWTEKAAALATTAGDGVVAGQLQKHLEGYWAGRSYTGRPISSSN